MLQSGRRALLYIHETTLSRTMRARWVQGCQQAKLDRPKVCKSTHAKPAMLQLPAPGSTRRCLPAAPALQRALSPAMHVHACGWVVPCSMSTRKCMGVKTQVHAAADVWHGSNSASVRHSSIAGVQHAASMHTFSTMSQPTLHPQRYLGSGHPPCLTMTCL